MNKTIFVIGLLTSAMGTIPFLVVLGVIPPGKPSPDEQPQWLAFVVGLVFICGGMSVILKSFVAGGPNDDLPATAPPVMRVAYRGLGIAIVGLLATLFSWVAFGPGARHFTVSMGGFAGQGSDIIGRALFGAAALLGWIIMGAMVASAARRQ